MSLRWDDKDPDEVLDYLIDWGSRRLDEGDTIVSSSWTVPAGLTQTDAAFTDTTTTVWLSGGTLGTTYEITSQIVTAGGRTMEQTARLRIGAK